MPFGGFSEVSLPLNMLLYLGVLPDAALKATSWPQSADSGLYSCRRRKTSKKYSFY